MFAPPPELESITSKLSRGSTIYAQIQSETARRRVLEAASSSTRAVPSSSSAVRAASELAATDDDSTPRTKAPPPTTNDDSLLNSALLPRGGTPETSARPRIEQLRRATDDGETVLSQLRRGSAIYQEAQRTAAHSLHRASARIS